MRLFAAVSRPNFGAFGAFRTVVKSIAAALRLTGDGVSRHIDPCSCCCSLAHCATGPYSPFVARVDVGADAFVRRGLAVFALVARRTSAASMRRRLQCVPPCTSSRRLLVAARCGPELARLCTKLRVSQSATKRLRKCEQARWRKARCADCPSPVTAPRRRRRRDLDDAPMGLVFGVGPRQLDRGGDALSKNVMCLASTPGRQSLGVVERRRRRPRRPRP